MNTKRKFKAKVAAKGVAPKRLTLSKHLTTESSLPRHPLPYAAKNMYYDEKWMEKQERGMEHAIMQNIDKIVNWENG